MRLYESNVTQMIPPHQIELKRKVWDSMFNSTCGIISVLCLVLMAQSGWSDSAEIHGEVKDIFNHGIAGVNVTLSNCAYSAITNPKGEYNIKYVPGEFAIIFKKNGYTEFHVEQKVSVSTVIPAKPITLIPNPEEEGVYIYDGPGRIGKLHPITLQFDPQKIGERKGGWKEMPVISDGYHCKLYIKKDDLKATNTLIRSNAQEKYIICFILKGYGMNSTIYQVDSKSNLSLLNGGNEADDDLLIMHYERWRHYLTEDPSNKFMYCKAIKPNCSEIQNGLYLVTMELTPGIYVFENKNFELPERGTFNGKSPEAPFNEGWLFIITQRNQQSMKINESEKSHVPDDSETRSLAAHEKEQKSQ